MAGCGTLAVGGTQPGGVGVQPQAVGGKHKTDFRGPEKLIFRIIVQAWPAMAQWAERSASGTCTWVRSPRGDSLVCVFCFAF